MFYYGRVATEHNEQEGHDNNTKIIETKEKQTMENTIVSVFCSEWRIELFITVISFSKCFSKRIVNYKMNFKQ